MKYYNKKSFSELQTSLKEMLKSINSSYEFISVCSNYNWFLISRALPLIIAGMAFFMCFLCDQPYHPLNPNASSMVDSGMRYFHKSSMFKNYLDFAFGVVLCVAVLTKIHISFLKQCTFRTYSIERKQGLWRDILFIFALLTLTAAGHAIVQNSITNDVIIRLLGIYLVQNSTFYLLVKMKLYGFTLVKRATPI